MVESQILKLARKLSLASRGSPVAVPNSRTEKAERLYF